MGSFSQSIVLPAPLHDARLVRYSIEEVLALLNERERLGFERGREAGERSLAQELLQQRADMHALQAGVLSQVRDSVRAMLDRCEDLMVELSGEIAIRVIGDSPVTRESIQHAVTDALRQVHDSTEFTVLLHPQDLELLGSASGLQGLPTSEGDRARFAPDPSVARGGCIVRTAFGVLDSRREVRIASLREALKP